MYFISFKQNIKKRSEKTKQINNKELKARESVPSTNRSVFIENGFRLITTERVPCGLQAFFSHFRHCITASICCYFFCILFATEQLMFYQWNVRASHFIVIGIGQVKPTKCEKSSFFPINHVLDLCSIAWMNCCFYHLYECLFNLTQFFPVSQWNLLRD